MAFSDRCGAAWRSTGGGGTIGVLVPMVRQVPCIRIRRCNLLLFQQLSAVHDDAVRRWRILHQKSILPCGADGAAAGRLPAGAPAPPPAYLTTAVSECRNVFLRWFMQTRFAVCCVRYCALVRSNWAGPLCGPVFHCTGTAVENVEKAIDRVDARRLVRVKISPRRVLDCPAPAGLFLDGWTARGRGEWQAGSRLGELVSAQSAKLSPLAAATGHFWKSCYSPHRLPGWCSALLPPGGA
jgi:hypothetical protein